MSFLSVQVVGVLFKNLNTNLSEDRTFIGLCEENYRANLKTQIATGMQPHTLGRMIIIQTAGERSPSDVPEAIFIIRTDMSKSVALAEI